MLSIKFYRRNFMFLCCYISIHVFFHPAFSNNLRITAGFFYLKLIIFFFLSLNNLKLMQEKEKDISYLLVWKLIIYLIMF